MSNRNNCDAVPTPLDPVPWLLVRADSDAEIGTGHVMRCIALSQAWQDAGGRAALLGKVGSGLRARLVQEDIAWWPLTAAYPDPGDLARTQELLEELAAPWVVLDGYHFDAGYIRALRETGRRVLLIEDQVQWLDYPVDLVLNQNLGAETRAEAYATAAHPLLGMSYALLRREFLAARIPPRTIPPRAQRLLVTFGGSDPAQLSELVIKSLAADDILRAIETRVIVGPANPRRSVLLDLAHSQNNIEILEGADMPTVMAWADLAVAAAGSTCWELAYMGLPALLYVVAENQRGIAKAAAEAGMAASLGWYNDVSASALTAALHEFIANKPRRTRMSAVGRRMVDGAGSMRVVVALSLMQALRDGI